MNTTSEANVRLHNVIRLIHLDI